MRMYISLSPSLSFSLFLSIVLLFAQKGWEGESESVSRKWAMSHQLCLQRLAVLPEAGQCSTWLYMSFLVSDSDNKLTVQNRQQRASPAWKLAIWFYAPSPVFGCRPQMFGRRWETQHSALNVMVQLPLWGCQGFSFSFLRPSCASTSWMRGPLGLVTFCPQKNQPLLTPIAGNMHLSVWTSDSDL